MADSDFDVANRFLQRREAGDVTAITEREANALREMRRRVQRSEAAEYRRCGFEGVSLSPYMESLMRMEGIS